MELAILDLETTGTRPEIDRIVEIAVVRTSALVETSHWSSLVAPGVSVGDSERVHGISDAMARDAPALADLAAPFAAATAGATLVAHRAGFDRAFLAAAAARGELAAAPAAMIDTAVVADRVLGEAGLRTLARTLGTRAPSHRALPDALAALDVLAACVAILGPVEADELLELSGPGASMRRSLVALLGDAAVRGADVGLVYRPASGRTHEDVLRVELLEPPYVTGTLLGKRVRRRLRGDRIVRAWLA